MARYSETLCLTSCAIAKPDALHTATDREPSGLGLYWESSLAGSSTSSLALSASRAFILACFALYLA